MKVFLRLVTCLLFLVSIAGCQKQNTSRVVFYCYPGGEAPSCDGTARICNSGTSFSGVFSFRTGKPSQPIAIVSFHDPCPGWKPPILPDLPMKVNVLFMGNTDSYGNLVVSVKKDFGFSLYDQWLMVLPAGRKDIVNSQLSIWPDRSLFSTTKIRFLDISDLLNAKAPFQGLLSLRKRFAFLSTSWLF